MPEWTQRANGHALVDEHGATLARVIRAPEDALERETGPAPELWCGFVGRGEVAVMASTEAECQRLVEESVTVPGIPATPPGAMTADVFLDYTNHAGKRSLRRIRPHENGLRFGHSDHHDDGPYWLLNAWDEDREATRTFRMDRVHSWRPVPTHPALDAEKTR